jgi:TPR repeat protein
MLKKLLLGILFFATLVFGSASFEDGMRALYDDWDYEKSFNIFEELSEEGNVEAQEMTGYFYAKGIGTKKDFQKALHWYKKACELKSDRGCKEYEELSNELQKEQMLLDLAKKGDKKAQYELGNLYSEMETLDGYFVVEKDLKKALKWYAESCDEYDEYYYESCKKYEELEEDLNKEKELLQTGTAEAYYQLAELYRRESYFLRDRKKAFEYYKKSSDLNFAEAQYEMGTIYDNTYGENIVKDYDGNKKKAYDYYKKACSNGLQIACEKTANILKHYPRIEQKNE